MANIPIWAGSSSFFPGDTPFGFYDNDFQFQQDADKVSKFCALRLGYPIENVELQSTNFFTAFEQAVTVYGNELFAYKQREDYLSIEGSEKSYEGTTTNFSTTLVTPNMGPIVRLSEQYGTEAGVGGNVTYFSGSIPLTASVQDYDLTTFAAQQGISASNLEIKKIFYEPNPASFEFYGGLGYTGTAISMFGESAGLTAYGGNQFLMMPLSFDLQAIQQLEMYRDVLFSNHTFQLINNKLRIFPIPDDTFKIYFQYIRKDDRWKTLTNEVTDEYTEGGVTAVQSDFSSIRYDNMRYKDINDVGKQWIRKYTLALCKELLGIIRSKYGTIPIPGSETNMDGDTLRSEATAEKEALVTTLREMLEQSTSNEIMEEEAQEAEHTQEILKKVPLKIYIG